MHSINKTIIAFDEESITTEGTKLAIWIKIIDKEGWGLGLDFSLWDHRKVLHQNSTFLM
jgi:hypothetical protein